MMVVAIQVLNLTFPFALGYGVARRDFYLGTTLSFVMLSVGYGALLTVLGYIEEATGGWGLGGKLFTAIYFSDGPGTNGSSASPCCSCSSSPSAWSMERSTRDGARQVS